MTDLRAILKRLLELEWPAPLAFGYELSDVTTERGLTLHLVKAGHVLPVWLRLATSVPSTALRTACFALGAHGARPDADGARAIESIKARLERQEGALSAEERRVLYAHELVWTSAGAPPVEWLAVRGGHKPALRQAVRSEWLADLRERAGRLGLHVEAAGAESFISGFSTQQARGSDTLVYVARTAETAREVLAIEGRFAAETRRVAKTALVHELGRALGYPPCCIDFFEPRSHQPNDFLRFAALAATRGEPSHRLNNLDPTHALVSHFVCCYQCAPSIAYADAVMTEVGAANPGYASALGEILRGPVAMTWQGRTLHSVFG